MRHLKRGGRYYRGLGPTFLWSGRPDDTSFSKKYGGRWNPKGEFGALYLAADLETARANGIEIVKRLFGDAASIDDLADPESFFEVQAFEIVTSAFVDALTTAGRKSLKLPLKSRKGAGYEQTQAIARKAYVGAEPGIAYLSALLPNDEELAIFDSQVSEITRPIGKRLPFNRMNSG